MGDKDFINEGAGMIQWEEHSAPTNVDQARIQQHSMLYHDVSKLKHGNVASMSNL